jgi:hypothetical protein
MPKFTVRETAYIFRDSESFMAADGKFRFTEEEARRDLYGLPPKQLFFSEDEARKALGLPPGAPLTEEQRQALLSAKTGWTFTEAEARKNLQLDSPASGLPWQQPERGSLIRMRGDEIVAEIPFQYNPTDWSMDISINWTSGEYPNSFLPPTSFASYGERVVKLELFFASPVYGDVEKRLAQLELAMAPNARYGRNAMHEAAPDPLRLCLKKQQAWPVVITSAEIRRLQFNQYMDATRAVAAMTFLLVSNSPVDQREYVRALRQKANQYG